MLRIVLLLCLCAISVQAQSRYHAALTQTGSAAPSAAVFENTLSGNPTLQRIAQGVYRVVRTGAFPTDAKITGKGIWVLNTVGTTITYMQVVWDDEAFPFGSAMIIQTYQVETTTGTTQYVDNALQQAEIDLTIYP